MRKRLFRMAAAVMTVVCLTGCSGNFSKASFINAAKKNGMKEVEDTTELTKIMADPGKTKAMYYVDSGKKGGGPASSRTVKQIPEFI